MEEHKNITHVVGIGASAGGLAALQSLFDAVPSDTGLAFVVVQHLSPDFKSLMDELLQARTSMPVRVIEDGMKVEPNTVFLNVARHDVALSNDMRFLLSRTTGEAQELHHPINSFFESLAGKLGSKSVAVILSGTGSDGALGATAVHRAGGLVIAQSPGSAEFDGMPIAAQQTGIVDLILKPAEIGRTLAFPDLDRHVVTKAELVRTDDYAPIFDMLEAKYGIDFAQYKAPTVTRRVHRRREFSDKATFKEYVAKLRVDPEELERLYRDLLIGVTLFFRDSEAFELLAESVLPVLARERGTNHLRVWVAACATGEEVYSLAILIDEYRRSAGVFDDFTIFATDVHEGSLATAREGFYETDKFGNVSEERITRYFLPEANGYKVSKTLRNRVVFATHNLLRDAPFTKIDLVTCRNFLIYIEPEAQQAVLATFHYALNPNGVLFLGPSESLGALDTAFTTIDQRWKLFARSVKPLPPSRRRLPSLASPKQSHGQFDRPVYFRESYEAIISRGYDAVLAHCMTSGILVDQRRRVLHVFGGSDQFLELRGRMSDDVLALVKDDLRTALAAALHRVQSDGKSVLYRKVRCMTEDVATLVDIAVQPIRSPRTEERYMLVTLKAPQQAEEVAFVHSVEGHNEAEERIRALEDELRISQSSLQATIEESETTNEELHATNEELIASNEELKSTNEELQSVNEELFSVNAEYQQKIAQLTQVTNDVNNLLSSTDIGTIFLDRTTAIRKFTAAAARSFSLLPQDLGRPIEHITHVLDYPDLLADINRVLEDNTPRSHKVRARGNTWYLVRLSPYRTDDDRTDGIVITLVDVTALKNAETKVLKSRERYRKLFEASEASLWECDVTDLVQEIARLSPTLDGFRHQLANDSGEIRRLWSKAAIIDVNAATLRTFDAATKEEFLSNRESIFVAEFFPFCRDLVIAIAQERKRFEAIVTLGTLRGRKIKTHFMFSLQAEEEERTSAIVSIMDITAEVEADLLGEKAEELERSNSELERFAYVASHDLQAPLRTVVNYMDLLKSHTNDLDQTSKEYIGRATASALRMKEQIDALLEFSRVNARDTESEDVDIEELITSLRDEFLAGVDKPFSIVMEGLPILHGHRYQFRQIFQNLIGNAIKFRAERPLEIRITGRPRSPGWLFEVQDNGIGIETEQAERIFDVFTRLHPRDEYPGAGIGLAVVRRVVESYDGRVWVTSEPGVGSRFTFTLHAEEVTRPCP